MQDIQNNIRAILQEIKHLDKTVTELKASNTHYTKKWEDVIQQNETKVKEHETRLTFLERIASKTEGGLSTLNRLLTLTSAGILGAIIWGASSIISLNQITSVNENQLAHMTLEIDKLSIQINEIKRQINHE